MHAFQKVDFDQFEVNPFDKIGKDWMLVTAGNEEKANTMTASWGEWVLCGAKMLFLSLSATAVLQKSSLTGKEDFH